MDNEEKEIKVEEEQEDSKIDPKKENKLKDKKQKEEIEKLKADLNHWKNEYYKAYADMANLRKSIEKDQQSIYKYRIEGFAQNLLGVLDAFDFAFKVEPTTKEMKNYLTGFQYVHNQLLEILKGEGIEEIQPVVGSKFDSATMHAIEIKEDDGEEDIITQVNLKGYKLHDHLIRAAMVVVTKHPEVKDEDDKEDKEKVC